MKNLSLLLVAACFLVVTGCSSLQTNKIPQGKPSSQVNKEDYWRARGKFSYRSDEVSESGNFDWRQEGDNYQLRLFGPLGMGSVRISGDTNLVRIKTRDQDISSDQPLSLLYRMTGFEIPLNSMPMWLTGKPASLSPSNIILDDKDRIQSFTERTWLLNYGNYEEINNQQTPMNIRAVKGDVNLRMIIKAWEFDNGKTEQ